MEYHNPVLLKESVEALVSNPSGVYVDVTYGGGGHSREVLQALDGNGHLLAFDQDKDVEPNLIIENEQFTFVPHNFRHLRRFLKINGYSQVDGIIADLGVSSHQFDSAERGFSFRFNADLDMRMDQEGETSAAHLLNTATEQNLQNIFSKYGEVRNSKSLAQKIVNDRQVKTIRTIGEFLDMINPLVRGNRAKYLAQVFQALRIEVNDEMTALEEFLEQCITMIKPGGRLVVISYHSLEDRMVKNFMKSGNANGDHISDDFGNIYRPFKLISKKAIVPTEIETKENSRARSAKMRIAEKF